MAKILVWNQGYQGSIPLTTIYYVEYVYLYLYIVHVCKCTIHKWVMNKWVGIIYLFIIHIFIFKN